MNGSSAAALLPPRLMLGLYIGEESHVPDGRKSRGDTADAAIPLPGDTNIDRIGPSSRGLASVRFSEGKLGSPGDDLRMTIDAVAAVWSSDWSRRITLSRN
jgi:hypothetical protein